VLLFARWRNPADDIEDRIYGDEVPLAPWYMCETCGGLYMAIDDLDMCCDISEPIADQIMEYNEMRKALRPNSAADRPGYGHD
jgi:hypothetical protein